MSNAQYGVYRLSGALQAEHIHHPLKVGTIRYA